MIVIVYTKPACPNCEAAKKLLEARGIEYEARDVEARPGLLRGLLEAYPEARQMPQVFIDGQRVGGLAGLRAALEQIERTKGETEK